ncbi:MAG TPA: hypothetical protein VKR82_16655 [Candidatus Acidoferrales bacterium]|nr:hypothetical protein [Candidatus Acidoferrales bacterium]
MITEMEGLAKRVECLERQNRLLKRAVVAVLSLAVVSGLWAQPRAARTIEAERFILRDSVGRARITIGTPKTSGAAIEMPADEPSIWISDTNGFDRVIVNTEGLRLANDATRPAASLTFEKGMGGRIRLYSNDGRLVYDAPK